MKTGERSSSIRRLLSRALDAIIDWAWTKKSRLGYFAALHRRVTQAVKDGIAKGQFDNGSLMERLDVNFAGRYLTAFEQMRSGSQPTLSWQIALRAASWWRPLVVEHLLAGINAHINLDLGVAANNTKTALPRTRVPANTFTRVRGCWPIARAE